MNSPQPSPGHRTRRSLRTLAAGVVLALLVGCQADEIQQYQVARVEESQSDKTQRLLVAVFPHRDRTWFFRMLGPTALIDAHKDEFERFLQTVRFTDKGNEPVTWTLPEGWAREAGNDMRFATLRFGPKDAPLEVWVTFLANKGAEAGGFVGQWRLDNVNRWRGQMGLKPIKEEDLDEPRKDQTSKKLVIDDVPVTLYELTGPGAVRGAKKGPFEMSRPAAQASGPPRYTVPAGWKEADKGAMAVAAFQAEDGKVKITLTPLSGAGGGLRQNVQRWREQLKLPAVSEEQMMRDIRQIEVAGAGAQFVDVAGPDAAGPARERLVAVVVPREGTTWFIKMVGPADLVAKQAAAFDAFLKSVRFDGGTGANHE
jgi:hypothetical protein